MLCIGTYAEHGLADYAIADAASGDVPQIAVAKKSLYWRQPDAYGQP
jgi:hypothetical protein